MEIQNWDEFMCLVLVFTGDRIPQTVVEVQLFEWMMEHDPELQNLQIPESLKEPPWHLLELRP